MPDAIFENPRLAAIYDAFDAGRKDLDHYLAITYELQANSVLDVGSGTGCFAVLLAGRGFAVTGLEPAEASFAIARKKPFGDKVDWILGTAADLPPLHVDAAFMTGNVAQVFVSDESWEETLSAVAQTLNAEGSLVFEVRDPAKKAWNDWTREKTYQKLLVPDVGVVEGWTQVTEVTSGVVRFRSTYIFARDGAKIVSESTLRFRNKEEILQSLERTGYRVRDIRDAPDRPGKEFVFIASLTEAAKRRNSSR